MSNRGRPPGPQTHNKAGAEQLLVEAMACVILRGEMDFLKVTPAERWTLYDLFPKGFGLAAYEDPQDGTVKVSLVGPDGFPVLVNMIRQANGDRVPRSAVPDFLKTTPDGTFKP